MLSVAVCGAAFLAGQAHGFEDEQEREHGWALSVEGKRFFPKHFLCVRVGANETEDIFVLKPAPSYTREDALATLHQEGLPGTVEFRLKLQYTADVVGLARAITREEPAQLVGGAHVGESVAWTPGERCPVVSINVPPPGNPAATAWRDRPLRSTVPTAFRQHAQRSLGVCDLMRH